MEPISTRTGCLGAVGLFFVVVYLIGRFSPTDKPPAARDVPRAAPPVESDRDALLRTTKSESPYAGEEVVKEFLKAPTQAKFSERELVRQNDNFALVRMTVDAPNSFGVMLRQTWCAVVVFQPPRGEHFQWNKTFGGWPCEGDMGDDKILMREAAANWPGASEELSGRHPRGKRGAL
jgi:hypothetical protein